MTNAHRLYTLALLTGGQKQALKNRQLFPEVIFALKYPGKQNKIKLSIYSFRGIIDK